MNFNTNVLEHEVLKFFLKHIFLFLDLLKETHLCRMQLLIVSMYETSSSRDFFNLKHFML